MAGSFLQTDPAAFVISAIKTCEDGSGWIVRGYNLSADSIQVKLRPLYIPEQAERANLAETALEKLSLDEDGTLILPVKSKQIATIKFSSAEDGD